MSNEPLAQQVCIDCAPGGDSLPISASAEEQGGSTQGSVDGAPATSQHLVANLNDPATFTPPELGLGPAVTIEYCDKCRWAPRASWISTELFLTFPAPTLASVTLLPCLEPAGRFRVWLKLPGKDSELMWDRKVEGAFPELKLLKQRIRNVIQPGHSLGHSDKGGSKTIEG